MISEYNRKVRCMKCGAEAYPSTTTDVTDLGHCLGIIRNVPCFKCAECDEILYTGDVVKTLENLVSAAKSLLQEIAVIDYSETA